MIHQAHYKKTFLITGGTGFLGSHIAVRLLAEGHRILLLARGQKQHSARERVRRLLDWFKVEESQRSRLEVLEGDLDYSFLGLDTKDAQFLINRVNETIHCASDTSFSTRKRENVERTNVNGLQNLLNVIQESCCRKFHLISTAYAAGKVSGLCREDFGQANTFHNVYEETKFQAEHIAARRCAQRGITLYVHRPSIVYGDSKSGKTLLFKALYYPIRISHYFQKVYTRDIMENNGNKAKAMGVYIGQDGTLHLPVRIESPEGSGINLIPVDHFIKAFMAIQETTSDGGVFHIVNPRNTAIQKLMDYIQRFFHIKGIRIADRKEFMTHPRNGLELLIENHIQAYSSYMRDNRIFENSRTAAILAKQNIVCPEFNYEIFATCTNYAVSVDWGRLLYQEGNTECMKKSLMDTKKFPHGKNVV
jgi:nucleoside-diphosphate-sugar epimerase